MRVARILCGVLILMLLGVALLLVRQPEQSQEFLVDSEASSTGSLHSYTLMRDSKRDVVVLLDYFMQNTEDLTRVGELHVMARIGAFDQVIQDREFPFAMGIALKLFENGTPRTLDSTQAISWLLDPANRIHDETGNRFLMRLHDATTNMSVTSVTRPTFVLLHVMVWMSVVCAITLLLVLRR